MTTKRVSQHAESTSVPATQSRAEIERLLKKYGAESLGYVEEADFAAVYFRLRGQAYRLDVRFPTLDDHDVKYTPAGTYRYDLTARKKAQEQLYRTRWRHLRLFVLAALNIDAVGGLPLEQALYAHLLLPSGQRMYDATREQLDEIAQSGLAPRLLESPRR